MPSCSKIPAVEPRHTSRPSYDLCWACVALSVPGKCLCAEFIRDVATDKKVKALRVKDYIHEAVANAFSLQRKWFIV